MTCLFNVLAAVLFAGNAANPNACELSPIPLPLVGRDMKLKDYRDSGHVNYQLPPSWWQN